MVFESMVDYVIMYTLVLKFFSFSINQENAKRFIFKLCFEISFFIQILPCCLLVGWHPLNVKTAEPIRHQFLCGNMTPENVNASYN